MNEEVAASVAGTVNPEPASSQASFASGWRLWAWLPICLVAVSVGSLSLGALVRADPALSHGIWILRPIFYVRHVEHAGAISAVSALLIAVGVTVVGLGVVAVAKEAPSKFPLFGAVLGFMLGGGCANVIELVTKGSVTDYIGIHPIGVASAGDLASDIGLATMPLLLARLAQRARDRIIATAVCCAAIVLINLVVTPRIDAIVLTVAVTAIGGGAWLIRELRSRTRTASAASAT